MDNLDSLKIVILEAPLETWQFRESRELFKKIISLKKEGYGSQLPPYVLPVDSFDFIATHIVICQKDNLSPLFAWKAVLLEKCRQYHRPFPLLSLIKNSPGRELYQKVIQEFIQSCSKKKERLAYFGGLTFSSKAHANGELHLLLWKIFYAMAILYRRDYQVAKALFAAILDFKTDVTFKRLGAASLLYRGKELPPLIIPHLHLIKLKLLCWDNTFSQ